MPAKILNCSGINTNCSQFFAKDFVNWSINLFAIAPFLINQTTAMRSMNLWHLINPSFICFRVLAWSSCGVSFSHLSVRLIFLLYLWGICGTTIAYLHVNLQLTAGWTAVVNDHAIVSLFMHYCCISNVTPVASSKLKAHFSATKSSGISCKSHVLFWYSDGPLRTV